MKIIRASLVEQNKWREVDDVIRSDMDDEMRRAWALDGYEGIAPLAIRKFGLHAMYRDDAYAMVYEFTDEQWTWFTLKYL